MARKGGDENRSGWTQPGGEPAPAEMWIGDGLDHEAASGGGGQSSATGPGRHGPGRTRWIALAAGFAVLVAVIAVQHYASGSRVGGAAPTSSAEPAPTAARTSASPDGSAPSSAGEGSAAATAASAAVSTSGTPVDSMTAGLSVSGMEMVSSAPDSAAADIGPRTSTASVRPFPAAKDWTLLGYGPAGLVRYRPATGQVVVTPVPPVQSGNPMISFLATPSGAIIRPIDDVEGYLVPDGKPATPLTGLLGEPTRVMPGPGPDHVWVTRSTAAASPDDERLDLVLVDARGMPAGQKISVPPGVGQGGGYSVRPDGAGYALVGGLGGTYDVTPDVARLVTHGEVLAAGPTGYLVSDCTDTAQCSMSVIDRATGKRRTIPGMPPSLGVFGLPGVLSPDGTHAVIWRFRPSGPAATLIDLKSGKGSSIEGAPTDDPSGSLLFTPDGRYLLMVTITGVVPIEVSTGKALPELPIPPVRMLALRPGG